VWLLDRYSSAYASNQYRALQQFFKWLAAEEEVSDPMAGLKPPRVPDKPVPVFAAGDLQRLERACAGRAFAERRDAALIAVFPHRFRHHFSHTWLDHGGAEGDLLELNGWTSPQMLRRYGASARSARARRSYDRVMEETP
jgi:integrase